MLRKKLDKSSFLHRGTAIPKAMAEMFGNPKETKDVVIQASGKLFEATIKAGNDDVEMPSMIIEPTEIKTVFGISFTSQFRIQLLK
jgi:hypothetical protein